MIFRDRLKGNLFPGEVVLADNGYGDYSCCIQAPGKSLEESAIIRARHETCNSRFKKFFSLGSAFRHPLSKHVYYFHAIANLTQIGILLGHRLFDI